MQFTLRRSLPWLLVLGSNVAMSAQAGPSAGLKPGVWQQHCQPDDGFCFKYPATWSVLGEVFEGNGVVVAPEQKEDRTLWDEITVALVVLPPKGDEDPVSIDQLIEQTMTSLHEQGQGVETLQRQQRTVDGKPAQMLKVGYHEKANDRDWIEQLVFIEGPQSEIYSIALKCAPPALAKFEPVFNQVLASWKLPEPEPPASAIDEEQPKQSAPPPKTTPKSNPQDPSPS